MTFCMEKNDASPSLHINDFTFSFTDVLSQLMLFGKLQPFLQEFASQHVIVQEINSRNDLEVDSAELMQRLRQAS